MYCIADFVTVTDTVFVIKVNFWHVGMGKTWWNVTKVWNQSSFMFYHLSSWRFGILLVQVKCNV